MTSAILAEREWIVCQLGARENYAIPLALHRAGRLKAMFTDSWVQPGTIATILPAKFGRRLRQRYADGLADACVQHYTASAIGFEMAAGVSRKASTPWPRIMARNAWFQTKVLRSLGRYIGAGNESTVVFSYSYTARRIFQVAKEAGCTTVLGQIDPGPTEEAIVADVVQKHADLKPKWSRAPQAYWRQWRDECELADRIIVNSGWAKAGLVRAGIDGAKIRIVPPAYDSDVDCSKRSYPAEFSKARPLRVLFLGSVIVRKGVAELFDAMRVLAQMPIEFRIVGRAGVEFPDDIRSSPNVVFAGAVSRREVSQHYAAADIFVLPTHSDGFGLTLVEAMAHGLPVISSRRCGDVVEHGVNGLLLEEITGKSIAAAITRCLNEAMTLPAWSRAAISTAETFSSPHFSKKLLASL